MSKCYKMVKDFKEKYPLTISFRLKKHCKVIEEHLNPGGHIVLAVDNRYGLTYFAGSKERLTGKYFEMGE